MEERRKSGAGAWSQRLQKGGERDVSLSAFLAMNGARDVAGSPSVYSSSPTSGLGAGFAGSAASAPEPPYHLVARVVARWPASTTTSIDATIETPWRKRLCGRITREDPP